MEVLHILGKHIPARSPPHRSSAFRLHGVAWVLCQHHDAQLRRPVYLRYGRPESQYVTFI